MPIPNEADKAKLSAAEVEVEAGADAALEKILGSRQGPDEEGADQVGEDEDPEVEAEGKEADQADDDEDEDVPEVAASGDDDAEDDGAQEKEEEAEAEEDTTPPELEDQVFDAEHALRRGGIPSRLVKQMGPEEKIALGAQFRERQVETDRAFNERAALSRRVGGSAEEAEAGQAGSVHPGDPGSANPEATGATNLAAAARPFVDKLVELNDPDEIAGALVEFADVAFKSSAKKLSSEMEALKAQMAPMLEQQIAAKLGPDFGGDISKLMPTAQALGATGMHGDKVGIDRAAALLKAAYRAQGGKIKKSPEQRQSTSRARRRGSTRPIKGQKSSPKKLTDDAKTNIRIRRIMDQGMRDKGQINKDL